MTKMAEKIWIEATAFGDTKPTEIVASTWEQACRWAQLLVEHSMVPDCSAVRRMERYDLKQYDVIIHSRTYYSEPEPTDA